MRLSAIERRYARALFDLARDVPAAEVLHQELETLVEAAQSSDVARRVLFTPIHPRARRRKVIEELARALELSRTVRVFALHLIEENRALALPGIVAALRQLVDQAAGRVKAFVRSARPLEAEESEALARALAERVGARVELEQSVDPAIIGGVVARVGDLLLDGSVRTQLYTLRERLREREGAA